MARTCDRPRRKAIEAATHFTEIVGTLARTEPERALSMRHCSASSLVGGVGAASAGSVVKRARMDHSHTWGPLQCIKKRYGYCVSCPSAQECASFPDHVIAAQPKAWIFVPNTLYFGVMLVARH